VLNSVYKLFKSTCWALPALGAGVAPRARGHPGGDSGIISLPRVESLAAAGQSRTEQD
jgi:hypothetical protein